MEQVALGDGLDHALIALRKNSLLIQTEHASNNLLSPKPNDAPYH